MSQMLTYDGMQTQTDYNQTPAHSWFETLGAQGGQRMTASYSPPGMLPCPQWIRVQGNNTGPTLLSPQFPK